MGRGVPLGGHGVGRGVPLGGHGGERGALRRPWWGEGCP